VKLITCYFISITTKEIKYGDNTNADATNFESANNQFKGALYYYIYIYDKKISIKLQKSLKNEIKK